MAFVGVLFVAACAGGPDAAELDSKANRTQTADPSTVARQPTTVTTADSQAAPIPTASTAGPPAASTAAANSTAVPLATPTTAPAAVTATPPTVAAGSSPPPAGTDTSCRAGGRLGVPAALDIAAPSCVTSGSWGFSANAGDSVTIRLEAARSSSARPYFAIFRGVSQIASAFQPPQECGSVATLERFVLPTSGQYEVLLHPGDDPTLPCRGSGPMMLTVTKN